MGGDGENPFEIFRDLDYIADRDIRVNKIGNLEQLADCYEDFLDKSSRLKHPHMTAYKIAGEMVEKYMTKGMECSMRKISSLCSCFKEFVSYNGFSNSGYFISAMLNRIMKITDSVKLEMTNPIDGLGCEFNGGIIQVKGDLGKYTAAYMKRGYIRVTGSVEDMCGFNMYDGTVIVYNNAKNFLGEYAQGGLIKVLGDAGTYVGCHNGFGYNHKRNNKGATIIVNGNAKWSVGMEMENGKIVLNGNYQLSSQIKGGEVYEKEKKVWPAKTKSLMN